MTDRRKCPCNIVDEHGLDLYPENKLPIYSFVHYTIVAQIALGTKTPEVYSLKR